MEENVKKRKKILTKKRWIKEKWKKKKNRRWKRVRGYNKSKENLREKMKGKIAKKMIKWSIW